MCSRIEQLIGGQASLLPVELSENAERLAQRYAAQLVARARPMPSATADTGEGDGAAKAVAVPVAVDSLELVRPRSVGVEHVGWWALATLGVLELLVDLGVNGVRRAALIGTIIGRMAAPGPERATWQWLCQMSALGELLDVDYEGLSLMRLYRASDQLMRQREAIESHLFDRVRDLFGLDETITLYDLTPTYFEGEAAAQPKAQRGRSKEKRSDCPLVTLGLVRDGSGPSTALRTGLVRRSRGFAGNAVEAHTLQGMLQGLNAAPGALAGGPRVTATGSSAAVAGASSIPTRPWRSRRSAARPSAFSACSAKTARKSVSTATPRDGNRWNRPSPPASSPASRRDSRSWPTT